MNGGRSQALRSVVLSSYGILPVNKTIIILVIGALWAILCEFLRGYFYTKDGQPTFISGLLKIIGPCGLFISVLIALMIKISAILVISGTLWYISCGLPQGYFYKNDGQPMFMSRLLKIIGPVGFLVFLLIPLIMSVFTNK